MPNHIAIIMDGNGRWAKAKGLPKIMGHKKGSEVVRNIIKTCIELNIQYLTLYAFSSENWNRPTHEVNDLMELLRFYLQAELENLQTNKIRLRIIGDINKLPEDVKLAIKNCEELTKHNNAVNLNIALSYGSRQEIINAVKNIANDIIKGKILPDDIDEQSFANYLYTNGIPEPDLLIRTSGEQRLSNFLLWQSAYTELFFTNILWPDFQPENLKEAITEFQNRERRYGTSKFD